MNEMFGTERRWLDGGPVLILSGLHSKIL